jgi:ribonuclease P protein component
MAGAARLRRSSDIAAVRSRGLSVRRAAFSLRALRGSTGRSRLAVSAPRSLGGAVMRNRARRRVRGAFARALPAPVALDIVVNVRGAALEAPFAALIEDAASALLDAAR